MVTGALDIDFRLILIAAELEQAELHFSLHLEADNEELKSWRG